MVQKGDLSSCQVHHATLIPVRWDENQRYTSTSRISINTPKWDMLSRCPSRIAFDISKIVSFLHSALHETMDADKNTAKPAKKNDLQLP